MKELFALVMALCMMLAAVSALADVAADNEAAWAKLPGDETSDHSVLLGYTAIIEPYYDILDDDKKTVDEMRKDAQYADLIFALDSGKYGYALKDLDGDGNDELLVGTMGSDDMLYGKMILLLATNDGTDAKTLFVSTEADAYYYAGGASFAYLHSSTGSDAVDTTSVLQNGALVDQKTSTAANDEVQMDLEAINAGDQPEEKK